MEAWHLVAPLIAAHSAIQHSRSGDPRLNPLDEAYIIVFGALKEHDEQRKAKHTCKNCKHCNDMKVVQKDEEPCATCLKGKKGFMKWEAQEC